MKDQTPSLPIEDVREEAHEILAALDASRSERVVFEGHWRRLWQLVREAKAAGMLHSQAHQGPWGLYRGGGLDQSGVAVYLIAGEFMLPIWPPDEPRSGTDLPTLLNWASVRVPAED
jgi:hypothetical protein